MTRYKGQTTNRQLERRFPNQYEIQIPQFGLGIKIMLIHNWLRMHSGEYANWSRCDRSMVKAYAVYGFASDADADAFRLFWESIQDLDHAGVYSMLDEQEAQIGRDAMAFVTPAKAEVVRA